MIHFVRINNSFLVTCFLQSEMVEELHCRGELIVGLKYETPDENSQAKKRPSKGCLYVLIKEAKNLPAVKSNGTSDPFCKRLVFIFYGEFYSLNWT